MTLNTMNKTSGDIVLGVSNLLNGKVDSIIVLEQMEIVNEKFSYSFLGILIPICLLTLYLNLYMLTVLWKKDKTIVNQLMIAELITNILFSLLGTFQQSSLYRGLDCRLYCYLHLFCKYLFLAFNRLVPVAIALYRWGLIWSFSYKIIWSIIWYDHLLT